MDRSLKKLTFNDDKYRKTGRPVPNLLEQVVSNNNTTVDAFCNIAMSKKQGNRRNCPINSSNQMIVKLYKSIYIYRVIKSPDPPRQGELGVDQVKLPIFPENITNLKIICQISSAQTFGSRFYRDFSKRGFSMGDIGVLHYSTIPVLTFCFIMRQLIMLRI